jgi:hypothetical protein
MHRIVLASAILALIFSATTANATLLHGRGASHAAKTRHIEQMNYGSSSVLEGRAAYSAHDVFIEHDPAFSPQQDEIYDAR